MGNAVVHGIKYSIEVKSLKLRAGSLPLRIFWTILIAISVVVLRANLLKSESITEDFITEDVIDIQELAREIIAFRDGKAPVRFKLLLEETVLWKDAKGKVGAVLTDKRFLAISITSTGWHEMSLRINEADKANAVVSMNIVLLVTAERMFGFSCESNRFIEQRLQLYDEVVASDTNMYVAVVVCTRLALGFAMGSKTFVEMPFRIHERFESLNTKSRVATVRTTSRVLTFHATDSSWTEVDRPIVK